MYNDLLQSSGQLRAPQAAAQEPLTGSVTLTSTMFTGEPKPKQSLILHTLGVLAKQPSHLQQEPKEQSSYPTTLEVQSSFSVP